jgi:integrase
MRSLKKEKYSWKVGNFTLHFEGQSRWKVSGRDLDGNYRRVRFQAENKSDAVRVAKEVLRHPAVKQQDEFPSIRISDALLQSSEQRNWKPATARHDAQCCEQFLQWVDRNGICYWHEIRFEHISRYQKQLVERRLAPDTIRLYMWPVRRAARWVASNWPRHYVNICENLRLICHRGGELTYNEDLGNPAFTIEQVLAFLNWLVHSNTWGRLAVPVALQTLAGLRLQEALRLRWNKVDFETGTITVDGDVKNRFSVRCIPVVSVLHWLLRRASESENIVDQDALITPYYSDYRHYSHAVRKAIKGWRPGVRMKPKDFRNTLPTVAFEKGWHSVYVERYLGHTPKAISERHYHGDQGSRMIPLYREKVVSFLEAEIRAWVKDRNTLILPGHF